MSPNVQRFTLLLSAALLAGSLACQMPTAAPQPGASRSATTGPEKDVTQRPGWLEVAGG